jgi:hypothetical protein
MSTPNAARDRLCFHRARHVPGDVTAKGGGPIAQQILVEATSEEKSRCNEGRQQAYD